MFLCRTLLTWTLPVLTLALIPLGVQGQNTYTVTNTNDSGTGSLRAAINDANDFSGTPADVIEFNISGSASPTSPHVIQPQSALPTIADPVLIDGTSEPDHTGGKPVIELDGTNAGGTTTALEVASGGSLTARDLAVINFGGFGLLLNDDAGNGNIVAGCHVGVRANGTTQAANGRSGVSISTSADNTTIGGSGADAANIISGNLGKGIQVYASAEVVGNIIGVNANGDPLGNSQSGILVNGDGATIGGAGTGEGNVIANNGNDGVEVSDVTPPNAGNSIRGNQIYFNGELGIDLVGGTEDSQSRTENDAGDADDGQNRFQNFPEIQSASYDASANEIAVTYLVPSDPNASGSGASAYPLTVDIYKAETDINTTEGEAPLGADTYTSSSPDDYAGCGSPPCTVTTTFSAPAGVSLSESDYVVATATDANGNTSEFSAQAQKLPVELASFDATQGEGSSVNLYWKTASEENNAGFRVEHQGPNATSWSKRGFVKGNGTTVKAQSYQFTADDLSVGTHRFRLQQIDVDGSTHLHNPVTVDLQMTKALRLAAPAPNPVKGTATASFAVKEQVQTTVALYNILGKQVATVYQGTPTAGEAQTLRIGTSDLASGVYFLRLQADGQSRTERLTVVR